jgi:hypothetical protein
MLIQMIELEEVRIKVSDEALEALVGLCVGGCSTNTIQIYCAFTAAG